MVCFYNYFCFCKSHKYIKKYKEEGKPSQGLEDKERLDLKELRKELGRPQRTKNLCSVMNQNERKQLRTLFLKKEEKRKEKRKAFKKKTTSELSL